MLEIIGYVLLGLLALILLLLAVPVFVRVTFFGELTATVFFLGIPVFRFSSAEKVPESPKTVAVEEQPDKSKDDPLSALALQLKQDGVGATLHSLGELARLAGGAFRRVLAALTVDKLVLRLLVAMNDASQTARTTGAVCAVLYPALTTLQAVLRIRKREVTVTPDFLGSTGRAEAEVILHTVPYRLLWAALWSFLAYRKWRKDLQIQIVTTVEEE